MDDSSVMDVRPAPSARTLSADPGLTVSGHVPTPQSFSLDRLMHLDRHELGPTEVSCFTGRRVASVESYVGARLIDVLAITGLPTLPRSELKCCVVVATGEDGYRAIFSWNELFNSSIGPGVLVLYERDGLPLGAHLGPFALLSAADTRMGPRHLRRLRSVAVQRL